MLIMENPKIVYQLDILVLDGDYLKALSGPRVWGGRDTGSPWPERTIPDWPFCPDILSEKSPPSSIGVPNLRKKERASGTLIHVTGKTIYFLMEVKIQGILPLPAFIPYPAPYLEIFDKQETLTFVLECDIPFPRMAVHSAPDDLPLTDGFTDLRRTKPASSKIWNGDTGNNHLGRDDPEPVRYFRTRQATQENQPDPSPVTWS